MILQYLNDIMSKPKELFCEREEYLLCILCGFPKNKKPLEIWSVARNFVLLGEIALRFYIIYNHRFILENYLLFPLKCKLPFILNTIKCYKHTKSYQPLSHKVFFF